MATSIVLRRLLSTTTRNLSPLSLRVNQITPISSTINRVLIKVFHLDGLVTWEEETPDDDEDDDDASDGWEGDDDPEAEAKIGDGGDGGVMLQDIPWGERALLIGHKVLLQFGNVMFLYSFKITPRGYVYVILDKLSNEYGCPSIEELENYNRQYKKRLDEVGALGELPDDLALEVSTPGAERILKVSEDLNRFKGLPTRVYYVEESNTEVSEKSGTFKLDSMEVEYGNCVLKLADVKENRDPQSKGRPMNHCGRQFFLKNLP